MNRHRSQSAFTLVELLVAMTVSGILVAMTASVYHVFTVTAGQDTVRTELAQNARVALDRISRELRQASNTVTDLPADANDTSVPQPGEIEFEDGHANDLSYKRYYISGTTLEMQIKEYYFPSNPTVRVRWNAVATDGSHPVASVIETDDIADQIQSLTVYGTDTVTVELVAAEDGQEFDLQTAIAGRNE